MGNSKRKPNQINLFHVQLYWKSITLNPSVEMLVFFLQHPKMFIMWPNQFIYEHEFAIGMYAAIK